MSRLDQHIKLVQAKLALGMLLRLLAWSILALGTLVLLTVLVERVCQVSLPRPMIWFWSSLGLAIGIPILLAVIRRPTARRAAIAIDERLGLKEKFSTALYVRPSNDPFAAATVRDAEKTAASISLNEKFPVRMPVTGIATLAMALLALGVMKWMPQFDLFGVQEHKAKFEQQKKVQVAIADHAVRQALAEIDSAPRQVTENPEVKLAQGEMRKLLKEGIADPPKASQKAQDTLKEIAAIKEKIKETNNYVTAVNELSAMNNVSPPSPEETGPVSDAHRALAEGKLEEAVNQLQKVVSDFDKMDKKEQEKAAEQMKKLANQVAQQANTPQAQKQIQNALQQAGVSQQQAQQMSSLMQQAANGNQQAGQQLQKMANQAIQQANQQAGQNPAQQQAMAQAIQKAVQQGQQKSNGQASAQQMAQATQGLAKAMQQAAQGQGQGGQPAKQGNQGQSQAQAAGGQPGGQQPGGQQPGGQGQAQANGQPGQGGQSAKQQMQQQVAQLQAMAKDAQAVAAGQSGQQGQDGTDQANGQGKASQGQWGKNPGEGQGGQFQQGQPQPAGHGGQGGPAVAAGGKRPDPTVAPFGIKRELSASETIDTGQIIAKSFVKAPAERGESKMKLSQAIEADSKDAASEVDQDRIPKAAQAAVKQYFDTLKNSPPQ